MDWLYLLIAILFLATAVWLLGASPSLRKRDEHNKKNPIDDSGYPPNYGDHNKLT
jgi:hypothetical protein